jgi:hypothetical protein
MFLKILVAVIGIGLFSLEIVLLAPKPQQGYIITNKGDTIACMLKGAQGLVGGAYYKTKNDTIYHETRVEDVKEYQYNKTHVIFRTIVMPGGITPVYMRLIDSGKINLYAFYEHVYRSWHTHLFAIKRNQSIIKVFGYNEQVDNKTSLAQLINDDQQATDYLNSSGKYTEKKVINSIKIYNGETPEKK